MAFLKLLKDAERWKSIDCLGHAGTERVLAVYRSDGFGESSTGQYCREGCRSHPGRGHPVQPWGRKMPWECHSLEKLFQSLDLLVLKLVGIVDLFCFRLANAFLEDFLAIFTALD